jgi:drug/metabolite transporter (DMT)-like permease
MTAHIAPRREALLADLALVGVTAVWGSTFIVNRLVLDSGPPLLFLILRFSLAALILLPLAMRRERSPHLVRDGAIVGGLLAIGIGCQIVGQVFTTASKAAFVTGLSVPLTPVATYVLTRKKPSGENLAGLALATCGFALLSWPSSSSRPR